MAAILKVSRQDEKLTLSIDADSLEEQSYRIAFQSRFETTES